MDLGERAFLQHVVVRDVLASAVQALNRASIQPMLLKGVWLQYAILPEGRVRPLADVDLLVAENEFERAIVALNAADFEGTAPDARQIVLRRGKDPLAVDLHRRLFDETSFRMPTSAVLSRAVGPVEVEGAKVWLPDPLDGFAHLIGHAAHSRTRLRDTDRMGDFVELAVHCSLAPDAVAAHLVACGMRRAARYVLGADTVGDSAFCRAVIAALPPDPLGVAFADLCAWAIPRTRITSPAGGALSYLLEDNLLQAGRALAHRSRIVLDRHRRHRWRRH